MIFFVPLEIIFAIAGNRKHRNTTRQLSHALEVFVVPFELVIFYTTIGKIADDHYEQRRLFATLEQVDTTDPVTLHEVWSRLASFSSAC